jgi:phosphoribosylanthranilate isomerase
VKFKICCISSVEEALLAVANGSYAIGLVGAMPSGPGVIDDALICEIANHELVKGSVETFLLTSNTNASDIIDHYHRCKTTSIQLVDAVTNETLTQIKNELPDVKLIQVIHVIDETSIEEALDKEQFVDYILLDSGNPNKAIKELGGTGRTHNWALSQAIVTHCTKPVFLAGGLNTDNVATAIQKVQPFGLDICSGVRTNGQLDKNILADFVNGIKSTISNNAD